MSNSNDKSQVELSELCKGLEISEEETTNQRHELLLHEIEAIEQYWGPTFR